MFCYFVEGFHGSSPFQCVHCGMLRGGVKSQKGASFKIIVVYAAVSDTFDSLLFALFVLEYLTGISVKEDMPSKEKE